MTCQRFLKTVASNPQNYVTLSQDEVSKRFYLIFERFQRIYRLVENTSHQVSI